MAHLFVDISSHGFGHLAQTAPVLNRLAELLPTLQVTLRSGLPLRKLRQRIHIPFAHIAAASDFGYVMIDALHIDYPATAAAYRTVGADFSARVATDATLLRQLEVKAVFSDVSYLPLAGAAQAGIPAAAMCSLNWADLFQHYFGHEPWAPPIHAAMLDAYRSATFLRTTPGMPMPALDKIVTIGPIAAPGRERRSELRAKVGAGETAQIVLVALGGIPTRLPIETWPYQPDTHWLVPANWLDGRRPASADFHAIETLGWPFVDLLRSADAVVTKPGYGTFAEAACNGTAVLYQRRQDWPEQEPLIEWLRTNARAREINAETLASGALAAVLEEVTAATAPPSPVPDGIEAAARHLADLLA
jgi:hypothetical protein